MITHTRTRTASLALGLTAVLLMSGCASEPAAAPTASPTGATTTATPPSTQSATPTSTPSPTPSAPDIDPQDPSTWVVTQAGIGPLELNVPFDAAMQSMPADARNDAENCAWTSFWSPQDASYQFVIGRDSAGAADAPVTVIDATSSPGTTLVVGPRTQEGIGIGSSLDEVAAVYPDAVPVDSPLGAGEGIPRYMQVGDSIFFTYYGGTDVVAGVTVTTAETPPYELCG